MPLLFECQNMITRTHRNTYPAGRLRLMRYGIRKMLQMEGSAVVEVRNVRY